MSERFVDDKRIGRSWQTTSEIDAKYTRYVESSLRYVRRRQPYVLRDAERLYRAIEEDDLSGEFEKYKSGNPTKEFLRDFEDFDVGNVELYKELYEKYWGWTNGNVDLKDPLTEKRNNQAFLFDQVYELVDYLDDPFADEV